MLEAVAKYCPEIYAFCMKAYTCQPTIKLAKYCPEIYAFCMKAYTCQTTIKCNDHTIISATGTQQGDPLDALLFCLALQPVLEQVSNELNIGYLDDVALGGLVSDVDNDVDMIRREAGRLGLELNDSECEIIYTDHTDLDFNLFPSISGFVHVAADDASLLGSPLCSGAGLKSVLESKCNELQITISRLHLLNSHYALCIIKNCISVPKFMHILRTARCFDNDLLLRFDSILRDGLISILNVSFSHSQWQQASLPVRDGGLGIRTAYSLASSAFLASAVSTLALQNRIFPRISDLNDTAFEDCLAFWSDSTYSVPLVEPVSHKQRAWEWGCWLHSRYTFF